MKLRAGASLLAFSVLSAGPASASSLPAIKTTDKNTVAECATPGRMMAYLKSRNGELADRFDTVATEYMRHGEALGIRWDYAFFQMIVETASLSYKRNGGWGDVKPKQNNFAGIGATGKGEPGESYPDVSTGVLAHLQHLLLYAGQTTENPVSERTRKVQEWKIVHPKAQKLGRPVTFTDLGGSWTVDHKYGDTIRSVEEKFSADFCNKTDPRPELVAEARNGRVAKVAAAAEDAPEKISGKDLARKARERARAEGDNSRSALGAKAVARATAETVAAEAKAAEPRNGAPVQPAVTLVNPGKPETGDAAQKPAKPAAPSFQTASAGALAKQAAPAAAPSKCRVWTASYGGQKAIIIKAVTDQGINYTVLDVNEGAERKEADAYISAYAKGGQSVGEFPNQSQALDKAFELCPEG